MLHLTIPTLAITLLLAHSGVANWHDCVASQASLTDTYDDPVGGGDSGSAFIYNGLHYDSTFDVSMLSITPPNTWY
ncbi:hypothetical protein LTR27_001951 [Elasticomyces elasticus]|nr:hypothetical protein LTR27_001951 [Elasticomyces elasticus]